MQANPVDEIPAFQELRNIWSLATAETIGRDLERARELASQVPPRARLKAEALVHDLERLERWIRDC